MRQIAIAGHGITAFGRAEGSTIVDLALESSHHAMTAADVSPEQIDGFYFGTYASAVLGGQNFPAAVIAAQLGLEGVPLVSVESACASGSVAVRQAMNMIAAGDAEVALVTGAEKMTAHDTPTVTDALARANDIASGSFRAGLTFPGFFALIARAYIDEYGANVNDLADVAVKNRRHGARNAHAQFRTEVTREQVLASRMIADPLHLFDCSPISDGAASVIVASLQWAREHTEQPIEILACEQACGPTAAEELRSFTTFPAAAKAARRAFARAGVSPADVDVAEVHDCFSIAEWVALEDLGLVDPGCAPAATSSGDTGLGGRIPVNPSGGLLSKGHPIGATGLGQMIEIVRQLRGNADNQVGGAELGLAHNIGGTGGLASISLFAAPR